MADSLRYTTLHKQLYRQRCYIAQPAKLDEAPESSGRLSAAAPGRAELGRGAHHDR